MPADMGGRRFAAGLGSLLGDLRGQVDRAIIEAKMQVDAATSELVSEIKTGHGKVVRAIRAETDAVRRGYLEVLGNDPPEAIDDKAKTEAPAAPEAPKTY